MEEREQLFSVQIKRDTAIFYLAIGLKNPMLQVRILFSPLLNSPLAQQVSARDFDSRWTGSIPVGVAMKEV